MKKYFLYWGCSLEASGANYLVSLKPVGKALGLAFEEIEDWNCCGASISYVGANDLSVKVLNARNLALAESKGGYDIIAPCSSCYIQMVKVNHEIQESETVAKQVNEILAEGGLKYTGKVKVRHLQDVLYHDVGVEKIKQKVTKPLNGLKVAGYVGCQSVRPYGEYDSVEKPVVQDRLLEALGRRGGRLSKKDAMLRVRHISHGDGTLPRTCARNILEDAVGHGAQMVSTVCPMCAMNLELYQERINRAHGTHFDVPIVYLTQLMAVAFGMDFKRDAALNYNIIPPEGILKAALG